MVARLMVEWLGIFPSVFPRMAGRVTRRRGGCKAPRWEGTALHRRPWITGSGAGGRRPVRTTAGARPLARRAADAVPGLFAEAAARVGRCLALVAVPIPPLPWV